MKLITAKEIQKQNWQGHVIVVEKEKIKSISDDWLLKNGQQNQFVLIDKEHPLKSNNGYFPNSFYVKKENHKNDYFSHYFICKSIEDAKKDHLIEKMIIIN